ncbi:MAG: hypothetical protein NTZ03_13840 [Actinobacteria bacterium]|nr:hypothetical protein [Actinomycetota bacterium]
MFTPIDMAVLAIPETDLNPESTQHVLALPSFLSSLGAIGDTTGSRYDALPLEIQGAVTLRRLHQLTSIARLNGAWNERLTNAPLSIDSFDDWQAIPLTDKESFADLFTGERPGMVIPLEHGGFEIVASGGTSSGRPSETVYELQELRDTYKCAGGFIGRHMLPHPMGDERPQWLTTTLADYQMWSSGTMVGGVLQRVPDVNYVGAGPMSADVFAHFMSYPGPKAIMGITQSIALLPTFATGLSEQARLSLRVAMYGSGVLTRRAHEDLIEAYPNVTILSYFAATQAEAIGLQLDHTSPALTTVPGLNFIEVVNEDGHWVDVGEQGELVVTRLFAHRVPALRYKVGDFVRRLPDTESEALCSTNFEYVGRSGDILHIGDTQYSAPRALASIFRAFRDQVGFDLEAAAFEVQLINRRGPRELVLLISTSDPTETSRELGQRLGSTGSATVIAAGLNQSLSIFNGLEANETSLARSGYAFGTQIVDPSSPAITRTSVGKVPLVVDHGS